MQYEEVDWKCIGKAEKYEDQRGLAEQKHSILIQVFMQCLLVRALMEKHYSCLSHGQALKKNSKVIHQHKQGEIHCKFIQQNDIV